VNETVKDVLIRALKTFWQAGLASLCLAIPEIIELIPSGWNAVVPVLVSACIGALAGGLSAAYNGVLKPLLEKYKKPIEEKGSDFR
jgi:hypothetical protein